MNIIKRFREWKNKPRGIHRAPWWGGCGPDGAGHMWQLVDSLENTKKNQIEVRYRCFACEEEYIEIEKIEEV